MVPLLTYKNCKAVSPKPDVLGNISMRTKKEGLEESQMASGQRITDGSGAWVELIAEEGLEESQMCRALGQRQTITESQMLPWARTATHASNKTMQLNNQPSGQVLQIYNPTKE